jgi:hypothetical protein
MPGVSASPHRADAATNPGDERFALGLDLLIQGLAAQAERERQDRR